MTITLYAPLSRSTLRRAIDPRLTDCSNQRGRETEKWRYPQVSIAAVAHKEVGTEVATKAAAEAKVEAT
jgi:hypothetical protein